MGLMEIYEDCCWCGLTMDYWRPVPWLQLREHCGNCIQMQTAPLLWHSNVPGQKRITIRDVSEDDAILWRISSLHTCHGSSDNFNGSKLGRSMVTAERIFCVKLRKRLASHEWASAGALFHIVSEVTCVTCVIMQRWHEAPMSHVRLWPGWGISWAIPTQSWAHGHWRPGDWALHEISWAVCADCHSSSCDMRWSLFVGNQTEGWRREIKLLSVYVSFWYRQDSM